MNATEVVIGKFHYDRKLKRKASQRRVLFKNLIRYLAKHDMLEETLIWGFDDIDAKGGFIDIAIKSVKKYQKRKLRKQITFGTGSILGKTDRTPQPTRLGRHYQLEWPYQTLNLRQKDYTQCADSI